jgi:hypothetical protein
VGTFTRPAQWAIQYREGGPLEAISRPSETENLTVRFVGGPRDGEELPFPKDHRLPLEVFTVCTIARAKDLAGHPDADAPHYTLTRPEQDESSVPRTYEWSARD